MRKVKWAMGCCGSSPVPAEEEDRDLFRHFRDIDVDDEGAEAEEGAGNHETQEENGNTAALLLAAVLSVLTASMYVFSL